MTNEDKMCAIFIVIFPSLMFPFFIKKDLIEWGAIKQMTLGTYFVSVLICMVMLSFAVFICSRRDKSKSEKILRQHREEERRLANQMVNYESDEDAKFRKHIETFMRDDFTVEMLDEDI